MMQPFAPTTRVTVTLREREVIADVRAGYGTHKVVRSTGNSPARSWR